MGNRPHRNGKGRQHTCHGSHKRNRAQTVNPAPGVYICIRYRFICFSHFFYPPMDILSLFTEVGKSQSCRRLVFLLLTEAGDYQNDDRNYIRQRLENFLHTSSQSGGCTDTGCRERRKGRAPHIAFSGFHRAKITRATASHPLSPKPLSVQVPPEYSITKYRPPRPARPAPMQVERYLYFVTLIPAASAVAWAFSDRAEVQSYLVRNRKIESTTAAMMHR